MFNFSLKQLNWVDLKNGNEQAISPEYLYVIEPDGDKYRVGYRERASTDPIQYATGFDSEKAAKSWAQNTHHKEKMQVWLHTDASTIGHILAWFKAAKPKPTFDDYTTQVGCHYEEVAEMIEAQEGGEVTAVSSIVRMLADNYKSQQTDNSRPIHQTLANNPQVTDDLEELDALCDQIVTALGTGYMKGYDMIGALIEVSRSNWSKFEDGKPVFKSNGKIGKGKNYTDPDLKPYLSAN